MCLDLIYYLYKVKMLLNLCLSEIDRIHINSRQIEKIGIRGSNLGVVTQSYENNSSRSTQIRVPTFDWGAPLTFWALIFLLPL